MDITDVLLALSALCTIAGFVLRLVDRMTSSKAHRKDR